jgi:GNAT superfamily N-acetyltransferase
MEDIIITGYDPKYAPDFKQLNVEWIEKYFTVEKHDLEELDNPEEHIISKGGYIFFALYNGTVVGTCALIKTGDREYYLAKMGVTPAMHGMQIGKKLGLACLEKAKAVGANRVWLGIEPYTCSCYQPLPQARLRRDPTRPDPVCKSRYTNGDIILGYRLPTCIFFILYPTFPFISLPCRITV